MNEPLWENVGSDTPCRCGRTLASFEWQPTSELSGNARVSCVCGNRATVSVTRAEIEQAAGWPETPRDMARRKLHDAMNAP